ncbi:hypothetical protein NKI88_31520 [Mesorhizobium sp. M0317]|uniref:hypothetical protein n=1 Tax=Mesorhizobium sp. M0317 TaxID=2956935 RepID=UPI00333617CF
MPSLVELRRTGQIARTVLLGVAQLTALVAEFPGRTGLISAPRLARDERIILIWLMVSGVK